MSTNKYLFTIVILILSLCSCEKGKEMQGIKISDINMNMRELITMEYSKEELDFINELDKNIYDLNTEFPIECVRETKSGFRVTYSENECILELFFDQQGNKTFGKIYNLSKEKSSFDEIIGESVENVKAIDPMGDYTFLYTGRNDIELLSTHYTEDGYLIKIIYDENNIAIDVSEELI